MIFNPPTFFYPQPLFYFSPISLYFTPQISPIALESKFPANENLKAETVTKDNMIIITRDDLAEEGYDQVKHAWSEHEDKLLLKLCRNQNARFEDIAKSIEGRNAKMCYSRYRRLTNTSKQSWSKVEDEKIKALVVENGQDWKTIATHFKNRNHKQIKDHYINYLRPDLKMSDWTIDEDMELIRLVNLHGTDWKLIQNCIQGRSRNQIKNRFFARIKRLNDKKKESLFGTQTQ